MGESLSVRLTRFIWKALACFPFGLLYFISDILYLILRYVLKYRYRVIEKNIRESFPEYSPDKRLEIINKYYHWLADYFVEAIKLASMSSDELKERMSFEGIEELEAYTRLGRSCALYLGHYGQWEWITSLPNWLGKEAQALQIYHPLQNKTFDILFKEVRELQGALCVPMDKTLRTVVDYHRAERPIIMGYIADQVPLWNSIHHWLNFLHHDTPVFTGSERIIRKFDQVTFYVDVERIKRGYYRGRLVLLTDKPQELGEYELTNQYFTLLEATIHRDPSIYLWSHNRWKRTREEYNLRYNPETKRFDHRPLEEILRDKNNHA